MQIKSYCCTADLLSFHSCSAVKNPPTIPETPLVESLGREDPLEEEMATHSSNTCLENPVDWEAWRATVRVFAEFNTTEATDSHAHWPSSGYKIHTTGLYDLALSTSPNSLWVPMCLSLCLLSIPIPFSISIPFLTHVSFPAPGPLR